MTFSILGTGMYVPEKAVTNHELLPYVDSSDEWIRQRVGVVQRHVCTDETASDLGYHAALNALENSGCKVEDIDLILAATISPEAFSPTLSCLIQQKLGATCPAYDISAACSAFIFLLETAAGYFARGKVKKVLVIGSEQMSRILDWRDKGTAIIFGDGAGAAVLGSGEGFLDSTITTLGGDEVIDIPTSIGNSPFFTLPQKKPLLRMEGQETFKYAINAICTDVEYLLKANNLKPEDIAYIVPHQANKRIIDFASVKLRIPPEKFYLNIENYGNTSSASVPIALDEMNRKGLLKKGDLIILSAFGGGLANGACLLRW